MIKNYRVRGFPDGLVTAVDESLLDPGMSPAMSNGDVSDAFAFTRRKGYGFLTDAAIGATVNAVYRYYQADGDKYWLAVCGTTVFAAKTTSAGAPLTRMELTTTNTAGELGSAAAPSYSGGAAIYGSGTLAATTPVCTWLKVSFPSISGSVKIDSGSWVSATGGTYTPTLASTGAVHKVEVKGQAVSTQTSFAATNWTVTAGATPTYGPSMIVPTDTDVYYWPAEYTDAQASFTVNVGGVEDLDSGIAMFRSTDADNHYGVSAETTHAVLYKMVDGVKTQLDYAWLGSMAQGAAVVVKFIGSAITVSISGVAVLSATDASHTNGYFGFASRAVDGEGASTGYATFDNLVITPYVVSDYIDYSSSDEFSRIAALSASATSWAFATLNDKVYFADDYTALRSWDGTTVASLAATPEGPAPAMGFLLEHKRRLFSAGKASDPSTMEYTATDDPTDWAGGGAARLAGKDSGGICSGYGVWDNRIYYFSPSRTFALTADGEDTTWVSRTISKQHGCIAPQSVAAAPNAIVFLAPDGVRAYGLMPGVNSEDGSGFVRLSENITPTIAAFTDAQKAAACGAFYRNQYWLAIGGKMFVCDLEKRTKNGYPVWVQYDYSGLTTIRCMHVTRGDEYGLYAGSTDGKIYKLDEGQTDNGAVIAMSYKTPPMMVDSYSTMKHFRIIDVGAAADATQSLTLTPTTDDLDGTTQTITVTAATDIQPVRTQLNARGRSLQLTLSSDGAAQPLAISELNIRYVPPRMR